MLGMHLKHFLKCKLINIIKKEKNKDKKVIYYKLVFKVNIFFYQQNIIPPPYNNKNFVVKNKTT